MMVDLGVSKPRISDPDEEAGTVSPPANEGTIRVYVELPLSSMPGRNGSTD
jgi:hypothetical protein